MGMRKINLFLNIISIIIIVLIAFYIIDMRRKSQGNQNQTSPTPTVATSQNEITPTQKPQETGTVPTVGSISMYLTAVGDKGESGEEFGCQDSIVPVQVEITPTTQPLHAAIQELLDTGQYYGQSGLYNALYQSDLTIKSIGIDDGHATIELTGTLRSGGVCDDPRIKEQLERTALHFTTVDSVTVLINGEEL